MTTRSKLLSNVLRAWDQSVEGRLYLEWLVDCDPELDGGDVLRESVLEIAEGEEKPRELLYKELDEAFMNWPPEEAEDAKEFAREITGLMLSAHSALRDRAVKMRELRHKLGLERLEVLKLIADAQRGMVDESQDIWKFIHAHEELSAKVASLCRTTTDVPADDLAKWRMEHDTARSTGGDFEEWKASEELDRYYSNKTIAQLEQIVERASSLDPVVLKVANNPVKVLFQEAHEVHLYGFDRACIALCRSLIEHALRDRLVVAPNANIHLLGKPNEDSLINRAGFQKLLEGPELMSAKNVAQSGNDVMHNVSYLRRAAKEVLDCTRLVLNKLYRTATAAPI